MKKIRIMSLGDIIKPDISKTMRSFCELITKKNPTLTASESSRAVATVTQENKDKIEDFKTGKRAEEKFTEEMISALHQKTKVTLTTEEFDHAWSAMQPSFEEYSSLLQEVVDYHRQSDQEVIFISATNPKDIRKIMSELEANKFAYKEQNGEIREIAGIPLYTTYGSKQTKDELLKSVITQILNEIKQPKVPVSILFKPQQTADIKYISSDNLISNPALSAELAHQNARIKTMLAELGIGVLEWGKNKQSLTELLNEPQASAQCRTKLTI